MTLRLDQLPFRQAATVVSVDWSQLTDADALRLRNLGLDEGVQVEALHGAQFGRDPLAIRIGRMTLAMRRAHARMVQQGLSDAHFEAVLGHLNDTLAELNVSKPLRDWAQALTDSHRKDVLGR